MKKTTKGALAMGAAAVLLTGGIGTLAYWTDDTTIGGATITSGHLKLVDASCAAWKLDGGTDFTAQKLVPGDSLSRVCTYKVDAAGTHLSATFQATAPGFGAGASTALTKELSLASAYKVNAAAATDGSSAVTVANGDVVTATLTVTWPYSSTDADAVAGRDNESNSLTGLTAALKDITVTATQAHSA